MGQTKQDPYKYQGSGQIWMRHINKHGYDVYTEILGTYKTKEELKEAGLNYSKFWDIVNSRKWANLKEETGDGGYYPCSEEVREKIRQSNIKRGPRTEETKEKIKKAKLGHYVSEETKIKLSRPRRPMSEETKIKLRGPRGPQKNPRTKK